MAQQQPAKDSGGGDPGETRGGTRGGVVRREFPATAYKGFVGQPVVCGKGCGVDIFATTGCKHIDRHIPGTIASRLGCEGNVLGKLSSFLTP